MTLAMPVVARESKRLHANIGRRSADLHLRAVLDRVGTQLRALDLSTLNVVIDSFDHFRRDIDPAEWTRLIADVIVPHPVLAQLHEEPFFHRAFAKPRGYAGDAELLDLAYRHHPNCDGLTPLGAALHVWKDQRPAALSVVERRAILGREIDAVAERCHSPRILSI